MMGRPRIYETVEELEEAIDSYFFPPVIEESDCVTFVSDRKELRAKVSITGLSLHLGFSDKSSLYDYKDRPEFFHPIKRALTMIEQYHEERLSENSVTGSIFALKNMGWKDKTEVDQNINGGVNVIMQPYKSHETK